MFSLTMWAQERQGKCHIYYFYIVYKLQTCNRAFIYHLSEHILSTVTVEILGFSIYSPTVTYNDTTVLGTVLAQNKRLSLSSRMYNLQITHKITQIFSNIYSYIIVGEFR